MASSQPMARARQEQPLPFEGFADRRCAFFHRLAKRQDRDWFFEHKAEFDEGWQTPMTSLLHEARAALDVAYPDLELGPPKVFRIYRDVRFSKDKSPYKTHVSGSIPVLANRGVASELEQPIALYLQLGTECFAGAGLYSLTGPQLARYREAVLDDKKGREIASLTRKLEAQGFGLGSHGTLARAPRGIAVDHPRVELLKRKGLVATFPEIPPSLIPSRGLLRWTVTQAKKTATLVRWLVYATA